ncbi:acyl-CoA Delta(11) desaturase [Culex quinquefasciatus]|uniref:Acyl-CoA Delta(11) desaturase n=1 Tax=Culex quinquefasciatus TaxID=7176 RepID=B0X4F5_CULQU|nr:acyl-CoA Delta(11) desaturase [Culex quinquefasciatus]|eukprot:XP_001864527.1 acyl-CoA Delta(11) desaturase [Culex quinquefasciatus]
MFADKKTKICSKWHQTLRIQSFRLATLTAAVKAPGNAFPPAPTNDNNNQIEKESAIEASHEDQFRPEIRWPDFIAQLFLHVGFLIGIWQVVTLQAKLYTVLWTVILVWCSGVGITAGAHRLWSHKSYKAKWPLRVLLMFLFTICGQRDAYTWAHDHRVHHKYSETDADPHNAKRGFFFAHVGWVFLTPHPEVVAKRKIIDMSDLEADPIVMWQKKYYLPLFALLVIGLPVLVPYYYWSENLWVAFWVCFTVRFTTTLNIAFFVNSVAHMFGNRPYDKNISPVENLPVAIAALGEGWHNYHHVFPWDYKTGELGSYMFNVTTGFIDAFAKLGWAYERKSVSPDIIERRAAKYGDGTRFLSDDCAHRDPVWGFGDTDIAKEDLDEILRRQE